MKILIVTGGDNAEREISFLSAKNVMASLMRIGHNVELFDLSLGFDELDKKLAGINLAFPVLHGIEGEGGKLQKFLEDRHVKFVGSSAKACFGGWDKIAFKKFCDKNNILTPKWQAIANEKEITIPLPYVIKTPDNGSSVDIYLVKNSEDFLKIDFEKIFLKNREILIEEFIKGIEVTVGVLKDTVLPPIEIVPPVDEMFDYQNKYNGQTQEIPNAPSLNNQQKNNLTEIVKKIHFGLGCKDISRSDFILKDNNFYALEINMIPGLTSESLYPKAAKSIGLNFDQMIEKLIAD